MKRKTTNNFKVGDKVYIHPKIDSNGEIQEYEWARTVFKHYIRATVTKIHNKLGYNLRAFEKDLPGIFVFNVWDAQLIPRENKSKKLLPPRENKNE